MISVVIPTLNEQDHIASTLQSLQILRRQGHEIIIVDGGSDDQTLLKIEALCDRVVHSPRGRAQQMNVGAQQAQGDLLWFLHADTQVSTIAINKLIELYKQDNNLWGRFDIRLSGQHYLLRIIERLINWRSRLTGIATGDQGIFVSRTLYAQSGGFSLMPLMEDIALSVTLKKISKPVCLTQTIVTSSRRWEEQGIIRTVFLMWGLRLGYALGVSPDVLVRYYR